MLFFRQSEKVLQLTSIHLTLRRLNATAKFKAKEALLDTKVATMSFCFTKVCSIKYIQVKSYKYSALTFLNS